MSTVRGSTCRNVSLRSRADRARCVIRSRPGLHHESERKGRDYHNHQCGQWVRAASGDSV